MVVLLFWTCLCLLVFMGGWELTRALYAKRDPETPDWCWRLLVVRGSLMLFFSVVFMMNHVS